MAKHLYFGLVCPQERSLLQFCMLNLYVELMMFRIGGFSLDVLKAGAAANDLQAASWCGSLHLHDDSFA